MTQKCRFLGRKEYDTDPTRRKQILFQKSSSKMAIGKQLQLSRIAKQTEVFRTVSGVNRRE